MEFRLDYIEREIKKLGLLLGAFLTGLKKPEETITENVQQVQNDITEMLDFDDETLLKTINSNQRYTSDNIKLLADIFYELYQRDGDENACRKSLLLYQKFMEGSSSTLDLHVFNRIQALQNLSPETF